MASIYNLCKLLNHAILVQQDKMLRMTAARPAELVGTYPQAICMGRGRSEEEQKVEQEEQEQ